MSKEDQRIIVVEENILFGNDGKDFFEGFRPAEQVEYEKRILDNIKIMRRGSINEPVDHPDGNAERNPNFKQPIGYAIILNPFTKKIFAYQRSIRDQEYSEKRLQGKWSWGIGGHIEPSDIKGNPIRESLLREIEEEVYLKEGLYGKPKVLGYIYHDFGIHKVHFGILYLVKTSGNVIPKGEMSQGRFMTLKELEEICLSKDCEVEEWSKTALEQLRKLL